SINSADFLHLNAVDDWKNSSHSDSDENGEERNQTEHPENEEEDVVEMDADGKKSAGGHGDKKVRKGKAKEDVEQKTSTKNLNCFKMTSGSTCDILLYKLLEDDDEPDQEELLQY
ncbi:MAG: hypothetical protein Q9192_009044, partial [Flavoplaca navasiana]